ncbi:MAG: hypothetical protein E7441_05390 [Ruminococcaceae bacterium]|nr:hypothetical protein [Oscillospiraceae bacterium]
MKKVVSLILAIAMIMTLAPSVFADDTETTAPADVVYDFATYTNSWSKLLYNSGNYTTIPSGLSYTTPTENGTNYYIVQPKNKNFSFNYSTGANDWKIGLTTTNSTGGATRVAANGNWESGAGKSSKAAIDIVVDNPGWYSPSFTGGLTAKGFKASIYLTATGEAASGTSYLGDYDFTYNGTETLASATCFEGTEKKLNAVYLTEGTHTLYFCFRAGVNSEYPYFINFKLYGLAGEPTIAAVNSTVPTDIMNIGETKELTAQVIDSNGNTISFGDFATYSNKDTKNTTNYLEVTSDNEDVIKVTSYAKGGLCNSENTNYTIEAIGGGVANLVYTPYIDGVAQTSYTKSVSVSGPITIDFSKSTDKGVSTPGYQINESAGTAATNWRKAGNYMRVTTTKPDATLSNVWPTVYNRSTKATFDINVPVAGFYSIKFLGGLSTVSALGSMYANGSYVGEYDFRTKDTTTNADKAVDGTERTLNTVYLSEGSNTFYIAIHGLTPNVQPLTFIRKITLTPVDSLAGKTTIAVGSVSSTDIPTTMTVGVTADATASVTMEDGSTRSFAAWAADSPKQDTTDSVTVTSSAPEIISVESVEDDALGASDKTTFTLLANAAGSADITVTATVGESTKTATYTVTSSEYNPNDVTTNPNVSVYIVAENADSSLISVTQGDVTAGNVGGEVARGTTITATATSNENYQFLYWMDNAKRYIQDDATYTFTAGTNTAVWAVYADKTDNLKLVDYFTDYGTRVYSIEAESEDGVTAPDLEMTGYSGGEWKKSIDNDEYVTFTPDWESATKSAVSVTLDGDAYKTGSYGDDFTVEKTLDGFVSWMKNGKLVSYNDKYTFFAWDEEEALVQLTEGEKSAFPGVVLFNDESKYMLELVNCEDVDIVEKGILFDGTIDSCQKKFVSRTNLSQFTIVEDTLTNAKAYVIYKDGTDLRVAYSD